MQGAGGSGSLYSQEDGRRGNFSRFRFRSWLSRKGSSTGARPVRVTRQVLDPQGFVPCVYLERAATRVVPPERVSRSTRHSQGCASGNSAARPRYQVIFPQGKVTGQLSRKGHLPGDRPLGSFARRIPMPCSFPGAISRKGQFFGQTSRKRAADGLSARGDPAAFPQGLAPPNHQKGIPERVTPLGGWAVTFSNGGTRRDSLARACFDRAAPARVLHNQMASARLRFGRVVAPGTPPQGRILT